MLYFGPTIDMDDTDMDTFNPHAAPPYHDRIVNYMRAHPGMSYERATAEAGAGAAPTNLVPYQRQASAVPDDPHAAPPRHGEILAYMRERPGLSYEAATAHVLYGA